MGSEMCIRDRPLPVYGDGLHVRDWIYVKDHCRGILAAIEQGTSGMVYNFGGDSERTNISVVKEILEILDCGQGSIRHVEDRLGHDRRYAIDSSRARSKVGWEPSVNFSDGLRDTVSWYVANREWWESSNLDG